MTAGNWRVIRWVAVLTVAVVILAIVIFRSDPSNATRASWMPGANTSPGLSPSVAPPSSLSPSPPTPSPSVTRTTRSATPKSTPKPPATSTALPANHLAVAVYDRRTGRETILNPSERFHTASIVKVDILATLLWQNQAANKALTSTQKSQAYKMITVSDNDAADALFAAIGKQTGLTQGNQAFGLTHTTVGTTTVHPWGQTLTTAGDQLKLLRVLTDPGGPLTAANQSYILGLMGQVTSSQRWGIPAAASHATTIDNKNGWLGEQSDNWLWIINSIGRIIEPGHDFLIVALSDHNKSMNSGIALVEHAATVTVAKVRVSA